MSATNMNTIAQDMCYIKNKEASVNKWISK